MYQIWTLNHNGWERLSHFVFDTFDEAFFKGLEIAARAEDYRYNQEVRIKYAETKLLDIHREGAKKLWAKINKH